MTPWRSFDLFSRIYLLTQKWAREKKAEKRGRHEERERKKERDVSASTPSSVRLMMALTPKRLFLSFSFSSCLPLFSAFFSRAHYWVNKYILKNACELQRVVLYFKDLFSRRFAAHHAGSLAANRWSLWHSDHKEVTNHSAHWTPLIRIHTYNEISQWNRKVLKRL